MAKSLPTEKGEEIAFRARALAALSRGLPNSQSRALERRFQLPFKRWEWALVGQVPCLPEEIEPGHGGAAGGHRGKRRASCSGVRKRFYVLRDTPSAECPRGPRPLMGILFRLLSPPPALQDPPSGRRGRTRQGEREQDNFWRQQVWPPPAEAGQASVGGGQTGTVRSTSWDRRYPAGHGRRWLHEGREGAEARGLDETLGLGSGAWGSSSKTETQSPALRQTPLQTRKLAVSHHRL